MLATLSARLYPRSPPSTEVRVHGMETIAFILCVMAAAGCGHDTGGQPDGSLDDAGPDDGGPALPAVVACGPMLPPSAMPSPGIRQTGGPGDGGPRSPALANSGVCTEVTTQLLRGEATSIVPNGLVALGSAIEFSGFGGPFPHGVDFVIPCDLALGSATVDASRIVVIGKQTGGQPLVVAASNLIYEAATHRLHFHAPELGVFQAALPVTAGQMFRRYYTFRGIGGVSMGGFGASLNFFAHPERYDVLAVMGAEPGADLSYQLGLYSEWFFAGFCDAASGKLGKTCAPTRPPLADQRELQMDFEHWVYQQGNGVGLTLRRSLYLRQFRDLARALGNPLYSPNSPVAQAVAASYLPPGVSPGVLSLQSNTFCDPIRSRAAALRDFYDRRFNPDGKLPVITFCDGGDANGFGVFDGTQGQTDPTQTLLAVDVNQNGVRDAGEPVLVQASEHFIDCGSDGLCDHDEPGYDAATNLDPAHDDYHFYRNPGGTEGNWRYDPGEHYDDFGVDGVKGTCQLGQVPSHGEAGCYDFGEGNSRFDVSPGAHRWYAHDPHSLLAGYLDIKPIAADQLDRLDVYLDAGIRDHGNAHVATNSLIGALNQRSQYVRLWEGFPLLLDVAPSAEDQFHAEQVDWSRLGRRAYVRYGDPDASDAAVAATGDGRHVGTALQSIHRAQMLLHFLSHTWPGGDVDTNAGAGQSIDRQFATATGRMTPYTVVTPPGYLDPANASQRYPVVYLLHGYGMKPADLAQLGNIASAAMTDATVPAERRMQKMVLVFVDGACRSGGNLGDVNTTVPIGGDLCEEGAFDSDHPEGPYLGEQMLAELQARVEQDFRIKPAADLDAVR